MRARLRPLLLPVCLGTAALLLSAGAASATQSTHRHLAPKRRAVPRISGTSRVGDRLRLSPGRWTRASRFRYVWKECNRYGVRCDVLRRQKSRGAKPRSQSYRLTTRDIGHTIRVTVVAINRWGTRSATSAPSGVVKPSASGTNPTTGPISGTGSPGPAPGFSPLRVVGTDLVNAGGQDVFLHGVDRSGTEYSCIQGDGFFDGTGTDFSEEDAQISSMAAWGINAELIPIDEDCWLGINGSPAAYSDSSSSPPTPGCSASQCPYANAIENLVKTDEANGIYPVISGFWMAPGTTKPSGHIALADNSHAPLLWEELADFFKTDPYVIFRLEQEPTLGYSSETDWKCWSQGDVSYGTGSDNAPPSAPTSTGTPDTCENGGLGIGYQTVGMQSLVNIVRGTGATNVIALPGLGYSNMLSCGASTSPSSCGMLDSATPPVSDPLTPAQLIASVDVYPESNVCGDQDNTSCYQATYEPVAQVMPLIAGETGENASGTTTTTYVDMFLNWMDANANGYFAWAWDTWANLISSYTNNSTPNTTWGTNYYNHIHTTTPTR